MRLTRWMDPSLPQTLQIAVWLLYLNAVFGVLFGTQFFIYGPLIGVAGLAASASPTGRDGGTSWPSPSRPWPC